MNTQPRRPYYNYSTPTRETSTAEVSTIENKRFWNLLKQLKNRTQSQQQQDDKTAKA